MAFARHEDVETCEQNFYMRLKNEKDECIKAQAAGKA